jgi:ADP-heptose:LPS heptosyltransferase
MYTHTVRRTPEPSVRHSVLNQWDLLAPLGIAETPDPADTPVEMAPSAAVGAALRATLRDLGVSEQHRIITVHVSASNPFKRWPGAAFTELVVQLVRRDPSRFVIVLSGPSEPEAAGGIVASARARLGADGRRVAAPALDLLALRELVARSSVYVGGDSGPLHVAATTDTPIVELLGPTVASRSFPWRSPDVFAEVVDAGPLPCRPCNERRCVPGDFRCLTGITPERVLEAAERALASSRTSP